MSTVLPVPQRKIGETAIALIESINHDGLGVARVDGKVTFIEGALPGERVHFVLRRHRKSYDLGRTLEILESSPDRAAPRCRYFGICGGCSLQHLRPEAQLPAKERLLSDNLRRIGKVEPETWLVPLTGPYWGYRRRARLGVRVVENKGGVVVGFREKARSFITPLNSCDVLDPRVGTLLPALRELIAGLSRPDRIPQIEVAAGDKAVALVFRHLVPLTEEDDARLTAFGETHFVQIFRQPGSPDDLVPLWPNPPRPLMYRLPKYNLELQFAPTDFIQVNAELNQAMVHQAIRLLNPQPSDRVLDLFCGLGNFSLPLARRAGHVTGVDAEAALIGKARENAARNGLKNLEFRQSDLYDPKVDVPRAPEQYDLWLLDPPRSGAIGLLKRLSTDARPIRIVYVSCNPATLARDSEVLVHAKGYRLRAAGIIDMFPQTSHIEAVALFERGN